MINFGRINAGVTPERYDALRQAILQNLPDDEEGMTWEELCHTVAPSLPNDLFPHLGAVRRYTRAIQADLEDRGLIERVPRVHPLRLRRKN